LNKVDNFVIDRDCDSGKTHNVSYSARETNFAHHRAFAARKKVVCEQRFDDMLDFSAVVVVASLLQGTVAGINASISVEAVPSATCSQRNLLLKK